MAENIHIKKFMDGKETPQETHRKIVYAGRKCPCGLPPASRAITFAPFKELWNREPERVSWLVQQNNGQVPIVELNTNGTPEKFIKLGEVFACDICKPALEKAMAGLPSWVLVDWDEGPDPRNKVQIVGAGV